MSADAARRRKPVELRHVQVHEGQIRMFAQRDLYSDQSVMRFQYAIATALQYQLNHQTGIIVVLYHQDGLLIFNHSRNHRRTIRVKGSRPAESMRSRRAASV